MIRRGFEGARGIGKGVFKCRRKIVKVVRWGERKRSQGTAVTAICEAVSAMSSSRFMGGSPEVANEGYSQEGLVEVEVLLEMLHGHGLTVAVVHGHGVRGPSC